MTNFRSRCGRTATPLRARNRLQVEQQSGASSISSATYGSPGAAGVEAGAHNSSTIHKIIMAANAGFTNRICWKA